MIFDGLVSGMWWVQVALRSIEIFQCYVYLKHNCYVIRGKADMMTVADRNPYTPFFLDASSLQCFARSSSGMGAPVPNSSLPQ